MSTDIEGLLRQGMERFTPDLRVPADLARTVVRRYRRRRTAVLAVAACAVIAVSTGAFAAARLAAGGPATAGGPAGTATGGHPGATVGVRTVAYVMRRAARAADQQHLVEYARSVDLLYPAKYYELSWTYYNTHTCTGSYLREEIRDGKALAQYATTWKSWGLTNTAVEYPGRDWARWSLRLSRATRCSAGPGVGQSTAARLPDYRQFLTWGLRHRSLLTIAGTETIDGVQAIKIVSAPSPLPPDQRPPTWEFWVNPRTYLPVRTLFKNLHVLPRLYRSDIQTDYLWLPPTQSNLARLTVRIPAGFKRKATTQVTYYNDCGFIPCF